MDIKNHVELVKVLKEIKRDLHGTHRQFINQSNAMINHLRLLKLELAYESGGSNIDTINLLTTSINLINGSLRKTVNEFAPTLHEFRSSIEKVRSEFDKFPGLTETVLDDIRRVRKDLLDNCWTDVNRVICEVDEFASE